MREDLTNKVFGKLKVLSYSHSKNGRYWETECLECDSIQILKTNSVKNNKNGCSKCSKHRTHGLTKTREHHIWLNMKYRCYKKTSQSYYRYGGRGITVCDRWLESFENFLEDMGYSPSDKYSLDRINNDGNYEPSNCKWVTAKEQANNTSRTVFLEYNGVKKSLRYWEDITGISKATLYSRLQKGWSIEQIITTPLDIKMSKVSTS